MKYSVEVWTEVEDHLIGMDPDFVCLRTRFQWLAEWKQRRMMKRHPNWVVAIMPLIVRVGYLPKHSA